MTKIIDVIERADFVAGESLLMEDLKEELKKRLSLPAEKRYERFSSGKQLFESFLHNIVFICLMRVSGRRVLKWFRMRFLEKLCDIEGGFVPGLNMVVLYSCFLKDFRNNTRFFDRMALDAHRAVVCRNRFLSELDRTLFYTRKALRRTEGKVRLKAYAAGMGLNPIMTLMLLRDEDPSYMDRLEFTITDLDERNVDRVKEMAELLGLQNNITAHTEDIHGPVREEGVKYHVQTAIGIILYFREYHHTGRLLRVMKDLSAKDGVVILDCQVKHYDRFVQHEIQKQKTKLICPKTISDIAAKAGLMPGLEFDRHLGCHLYQSLPVMVFSS
jgi:hypothetical protein